MYVSCSFNHFVFLIGDMGNLDDEGVATEEPMDSSTSADEGDLVHLTSGTSNFLTLPHSVYIKNGLHTMVP